MAGLSEMQRRRIELQQREKLQEVFIRTTPYIYEQGSQWTGVKQLGRGGQGIAGLWVKSDDQGRIIQRMVVKETQPSKDYWDEESTWLPNSNRQIPREAVSMLFNRSGNEQLRGIVKCFKKRNLAMRVLSRSLKRLRRSGRRQSVPADPEADPHSDDEVYDEDSDDAAEAPQATATGNDRPMQEILESLNITPLPLPAVPQRETRAHPLDRDNGIVQTFAYAVQPQRMTWRIYMEFLACGDGFEMLKEHHNARSDVPEPFLWFLLYRLLHACSEMEKIISIPGGAHRLVHQDIKPGNLFFDRANQGHYPLWPLGKIGDFGSARITASTYQAVPGLETVTPNWIAPENFNERGVYAGGPITPAINTWACARIILCLMLLGEPHGTFDPDSGETVPFETVAAREPGPASVPPVSADAMTTIENAPDSGGSTIPPDAMAAIVASAAREDDAFRNPTPPFDLIDPNGRPRRLYSPQLIRVVTGCLAQFPRNRYAPRDVMAYIRANEARLLGGMGPDGMVSVDAGRAVRFGGSGLDHMYRDGLKVSQVN